MATIHRIRIYLLQLLAAGLLLPGIAQAAPPAPPVSPMPAANVNIIQVPIYKSRVLATRAAVKRVSVGNPEIADILVTSPTQLYLLGRKLGSTNVLLWDHGNRLIDSLDVEVGHDLSGLKDKLHQLMPNEKIEVFSAQGALVLRGQVTSAAAMDTALRLAKTYTAQTAGVVDDKGKGAAAGAAPGDAPDVVNLMTIGGSQQVMLEVKVAEVQRSLLKSMNINFAALGTGAGNWVLGGINRGISPGSGKALLAQFASDSFQFNMVLDAAKNDGSAKVLAEPTLTTLTGQQAEFISGGEFPVPVDDGDNGTTIEYKEFGVGLKFIPVALDTGRINLNLNVSVSEISNSNSLLLDTGVDSGEGGGVVDQRITQLVPSLTKRSAQSTLELGDGQTIAIAGLISENTRDLVNRFPGLGDIPILGFLFRSQEYRNGQTELVILVTPHLVRPLDAKTVQLPTQNFVEPSDLDFYLLGRTKGTGPGRAVPVSLGVTGGQFGHDLN
ncbi:type II and III secretion system protein family protein [Pseudomonas sp. N040]|uniref:type II and III secretion system protein family protein n=1 Tax=Pseudomonas sp. N040 TaxID=2785325 RepID=UPI0018A2E1D4|nr:type II and III secretion system protein family protein [Pseudomonas sp. N040]MBF7728650.1 type II and III secretion system protein family protein [Pseudomonas sp. N040]MBW7012290.1 type II and III secretion system protein family protein [Pseudomonas sp. N040]